ncbi:hypothetical protein LTR16_005799 [Cryomyces antarcticus]|uniref:Uncharacterized protein n=1 Tax=Cryomyces antarcticus TaxID=329879 RepID=A0ABR0M599_9PEZI|nr:hypothetical protein LTR60_005725 [Cryomyces antarcticus]KAK5007951.1 hypothetical protein LTR39_005292 [Cryomyces antarcticus]KAK5282506.1 hypothetical protein LTR16_005799 [Cryomyces antarcticus]
MFTTTRRALPFNGTNPRLFRNPIKLTTSSVSHAPAHSSLPCFLRLRGERHRRKQALPTKYDTKYFTTKIPTFMNRRLLRDDLKHEPPHKYDIKYKTPSLPPTTNRLPAFLDSISADRGYLDGAAQLVHDNPAGVPHTLDYAQIFTIAAISMHAPSPLHWLVPVRCALGFWTPNQ